MLNQIEFSQRSELEKELRALRQRIKQREEALAVLNRRLIQLERNDVGRPGRERAGSSDLVSENADLRRQRDAAMQESLLARQESATARQELQALRSTRLFRWAEPARRIYSKTRGR